MRMPRIRNDYLHFGGKIKRRKTKRRRGTKRRRQKGGAFLGPVLASASNKFIKRYLKKNTSVCAQSKKRKRRKIKKK